MSKIKVVVEDSQKNLYQGEFDIPEITCRTQARQELNKIINEVVEEFETTNLTIKLFGHCVVYKKGRILKPQTLFTVGKNYQKLVDLYSMVLN